MIRASIAIVFVSLVGCIPDTKRLAGFSHDAASYKRGILGTELKLNANINGEVTVKVDPDTQKVTEFHAKLVSDRHTILDAEGNRVITADLAGLRRDNYAFQLEALQKITDGVTNLASTLITAGLARGGGEGQSMVSRGMSLIDQLSPLLQAAQGGTGGIDVASLLALLKQSAPPPIVVVQPPVHVQPQGGILPQ